MQKNHKTDYWMKKEKSEIFQQIEKLEKLLENLSKTFGNDSGKNKKSNKKISEHIKLLQKLKTEQERYLLVQEATEQGIWDWNLKTGEVYFSPQWKNQIGYKDDELENKFAVWEEHLHPDDDKRSHQAVESYLSDPEDEFILEFRFRHKDGSYRWIHNKASSILDEKGQVVRMFGAHTDVTRKKKMEDILRASEEKHRAIFNSAVDAIIIVDMNGTIKEVNQTACRLYGYEYDEFIGMKVLNLIHPDYHKNFAQFRKTLEKESKYTGKTVDLKKDGTQFHTEVYGSLIMIENQLHMMAIIKDVTSQRNLKKKLKASTNKFGRLIKSINIPVAYMKNGERFEFINEKFIDLFGYTLEDLQTIDDWWEKAYPDPEYRKLVIDNWNRALKKADINKTDIRSDDYTVTCKDGSERITAIAGIVTEDGFLATFIDVTERKRKERVLLEKEEKFRKLFESEPDAIFLADAKSGKIIDANSAASDLMQMSHKRLTEMHQSELHPADKREEIAVLFADFATGKQKEPVEIVIKNSDEKIIPVEVVGNIFTIDNQTYALGIFRDISKRKKTEKEKEKAIFDLQERIKEIQCLYRISEIARSKEKNKDDLINKIITAIPSGFLYPDHTKVKFKLDQKEYSSEGYNKSEEFLAKKLIVSGVDRGEIEISLQKDNKDCQFLPEEEKLLDTICSIIDQSLSRRDYMKQLKESEALYRTLIQNSPIGKVIMNHEGKIELINNSFTDLLGYNLEEVPTVEVWWQKAYPDPDYRKKIKKEWDKDLAEAIVQKRSTKTFEVKLRGKDGENKVVNVTGTAIGEKILVAFSDITKRVQAEEERDLFFKMSLDLLCIAGVDGYFKQMNPAWEKLLGWSKKELLSKPFIDFVHPDDVETTLREVEKLAENKPAINFINRYRHKNGSYKILSWVSVPYQGKIYASATDITELKEVENKLKEASRQLDLALENGEIGVWEWKINSNEVVWDERMEKMFGFTPGTYDNTFESFINRIHPDDVEKTKRALDQALKKNKKYQTVYRIINKNNTVRHIKTAGGIVRDKQKKAVKMTGVCIDITKIKRTELKLLQLTKRLKQSNKELEQFAYVASHDLQEPLRMVSSYTQLLQRRYKGKLDEKADKYIHYAVDGATRMQKLINDLLSFSRINTRGGDLSQVAAEDLIKDALANLKGTIDKSGAVVKYEELPMIKVDSSQYMRLFQNLIANSIKFRGDKTPEIKISAEERENDWLFSVQDNGIGIKKKFENKVFVIFQRLHSRNDYPGTGIGLAICKRIVSKHGGSIWFESTAGKGTTFYFTLPSEHIV